MKFKIIWTMLLDVNTEQKCTKVIDKIVSAMQGNFTDLKVDRYWKDKTLFKVRAVSRFDEATKERAYYAAMSLASRLATVWISSVPSVEEVWEFAGTTQPGSVRIPAIDSIGFTASQATTQAG